MAPQLTELARGMISLALLTASAQPLAACASVSAGEHALQLLEAGGLEDEGHTRSDQRPAPTPVTLVSEEVLKSLLPELPGWQRTSTIDASAQMMLGGTAAKGYYQSGSSEILLLIHDTGSSSEDRALFLAVLKQADSVKAGQSSNEGLKRITIRGNPGFEQVPREPDYGLLTVRVADRFVVMAQGDGTHAEDLRKLVEAIDLTKLAQMK